MRKLLFFSPHESARRTSLLTNGLLVSLAVAMGVLTGHYVTTEEGPTFLTTVVVAVVGAIAFFKPEIGVSILYPLSFLWSGVSVGFGPMPDMSPERLVIFLTGSSLLGQVVLRKRRLVAVPRLVLYGATIWLGMNVLSLTQNLTADGLAALFRLVAKVLLGYITYCLLDSEDRIRTAAHTFIGGAVISSIVGLFFVLWSGDPSVLLHDTTVDWKYGYWINLIYVTSRGVDIAILPAWAVLAEWRHRSVSWHRRLLFLVILFLLGMYLIHGKRQPYLYLGASAVALAMQSLRREHRRGFLLILAVGALTAWVILPANPYLVQRLTLETPGLLRAGYDPRQILLRTSVSLASRRLLTGYGVGSFSGTLIAQGGSLLGHKSDAPSLPSHSSVTTALLETGIIGFLGLLWLLAAWTRELWLASRVTTGGYLDALLSTWPLFAVTVWGMNTVGQAIQANYFWFLFGLLLAAARVAQQNASSLREGVSPGGKQRQASPVG